MAPKHEYKPSHNASAYYSLAPKGIYLSGRLANRVVRTNPGGQLGGYPETKILGVGYLAYPRVTGRFLGNRRNNVLKPREPII
jgi:hypothetical protein